MKQNMNVRYLTCVAMFLALSFVAVLLASGIPNVQGFLSYEPKDTVIVIAGFIFGPMTCVILAILSAFLEMVTISSTGFWGLLMNVLSTCAFACTAAWYYQRHRTMKGAILGLVIGALLMTAVMLLWNYLITPIYMGYPREAVAKLLIPTFLPFNLIKAGINGALSMLLYKPIVTALRKAKLVEPSKSAGGGKQKLGVAIVSFVVLVTFILLALVLAKVI